MTTNNDIFDKLDEAYYMRFGVGFGVPFGASDFTKDDFIREMTYSLETGIPFDKDSPRWRWREEVPDYVVI